MPAYYTERLDRAPDLLDLARSFPDCFPYLLESAARGELGATSLLLFAGSETSICEAAGRSGEANSGSSFFERLEEWYQREKLATPEPPVGEELRPPFIGGWFLFLGYEMAGEIEPKLNLPPNRTGFPDAIAHRCPGAVILFHDARDRSRDRAIVVAETSEILGRIVRRVGEGRGRSGAAASSCALANVREEDPVRFKSAVARIHEYLRAGDVFQVNISRPWTGTFESEVDPYELYQALRFTNPAPFAGLVRRGDFVLLSSSPERLVQTRDGRVQTRPIAGTRPRSYDVREDRALSEELLSNLKERAEHVMLIDLERNDLGRVCIPGTIEVDQLMVLESYAHVHHIVSNVRGRLRDDASPVDAIKAVFPGGTITGCPKVRCMEIIAELEGAGRGFYTGSMGYLDRSGQMDLNILIRSMLVTGRTVMFRTGAGIVADSVPDRELEETADKARGMLLAVEAHGG